MRFRHESLLTTKIELYFHDEYLTSATGFIYRWAQLVGLVTNWHVFAGKNPDTGVPLHSLGYTPTHAKFHIAIRNGQEGHVIFKDLHLPIRDGDDEYWFKHIGYKNSEGVDKTVDIGVLCINDSFREFADIWRLIAAFPAMVVYTQTEDGESFIRSAYPRVASDVFILGYPKGISSHDMLPVWKRGTIASEPLYSILNGAPAMLVDALTRDGMSGSPVLYYGDEMVTDSGDIVPRWSETGEPNLVGVYAGREGVTRNEVDMAVGRVWHKNLVDDIFTEIARSGKFYHADRK